ncbi:MAG TPA: PAS domain S-box protein, partial [Gemmatimonadaceae bacterium]|nr:PAS domain S-box protein [Gemmatimonadaceae bacterium]
MPSRDRAVEGATGGRDGAAVTAAPSALITAALAQLAEGVVVADAAGRITFVNDAAARLHGVARLDVAPADYAESYHLLTEDGRPYSSEELPLARAVLRGETVLEARWRIRRPDGTEILAVGSAQPVLGPGGEQLGAVLTLRDESALWHAERRSERLLEQVSDEHLTMDADFRIVSLNRAAEVALGVDRDAIVGRTHWEAFPASRGSEAERRYRRVASLGVEEHFTHHYVGEGYDRVIEIDAYPTAEGGVAVFWRDISARIAAEEALRQRNSELADQAVELEFANRQLQQSAVQLELANVELQAISVELTERTLTAERAAAALEESESHLRTLANSLPTLAWTARADGYIDWYNARWHSYTGTTPAQMEGWGWQSVHDERVLPDVMARWSASIESGEPFEMTFPLRGADGEFRRFVTRIVPMRDLDGRVLRWFGTNTDIEVERAAREAAEQAVARIERLQELTAAFGGATTIDDVASVIVAEVGGRTGETTASLLLREPGTDTVGIQRHSGLDAITLQRFSRLSIDSTSIGTRCMRLAQPIFVESRGELDVTFPELTDMFDRLGIRSVASVPLITNGAVLGVVTYTYGVERSFSRAERDFHVTIGQQAAQALERARLLASERAATERAERLQRLVSRLNVAHSSEEIVDAVFTGATEAVEADAGSFCFVHGDGEAAQFTLIRSAGYDALLQSRYQQFPLSPGRPLSDAVLERKIRLAGSGAEWNAQWPTAPESVLDLGFESFAAVPIVAGGRAIAALSFAFREPRSFDDAMRTFLGT